MSRSYRICRSVVNAKQDLVRALCRDAASHPDLVSFVTGGDVWNDSLDVQPFTSPERARELGSLRRRQNEP